MEKGSQIIGIKLHAMTISWTSLKMSGCVIVYRFDDGFSRFSEGNAIR